MTQPQHDEAYRTPGYPSHPAACRCNGSGRIPTGRLIVLDERAAHGHANLRAEYEPCPVVPPPPHPSTCQCAGTGRWFTTGPGRGIDLDTFPYRPSEVIVSYGACPAVPQGVAA